jgi:hypothetical protein
VLEAVQRDHRVRQRHHQLFGGLDLIRRLALGGSDAGEKLVVSLDLGGEALLGLVMPLRLLLGRLGAAFDLGKLSTAAGQSLFHDRFSPAAGGLLGFFGLVPQLLLGEGLAGDSHARGRLITGLMKKSRCVMIHIFSNKSTVIKLTVVMIGVNEEIYLE